jgi:hypothetical protein
MLNEPIILRHRDTVAGHFLSYSCRALSLIKIGFRFYHSRSIFYSRTHLGYIRERIEWIVGFECKIDILQ